MGIHCAIYIYIYVGIHCVISCGSDVIIGKFVQEGRSIVNG